MNNDNRGQIVPDGNMLRIDNALVEEVSFSGRNTGSILVSYANPRPNGTTQTGQLRLNVTNNTVIMNSFGLPMCLCDIYKGMFINTTFSTAMTRSIPPQANAFSIIARRTAPPVQNITTGIILRVDNENNMFETINPGDRDKRIRFVVTNQTIIQNRNGFPVSLCSLRPGQTVRVTHANFQTASIPPQTTAFRVQVL